MVWAVISGVSLAAIGALEGFQPVQTISRDALRFAVTVGTFCPVMAVLGAKRPQDRGWQWIVLSLWAVAVWPAVQAALLPAGTVIDLFIVWKLFLVGLVVVGLLNYLPTQYWKESILVAVGQWILLDRYLWQWFAMSSNDAVALATFCFLVASLVTIRSCQKSCLAQSVAIEALQNFEQQWLTFRNRFGAFWGLRILARVNETAELRQWPFRLTWAGFISHPEGTNDSPTDAQMAELEQTMSTLLRRFNKITTEE